MSAKKYHFTPEIKEQLRKIYLTEVGIKPVADRGAVKDLATKTGIPRWKLSRQAREMGLLAKQKKEPPWSDRELRILHSSAHLSLDRIQIHLKKVGFKRSTQGIYVKRKRMRFMANLNGQSATSTAMCFGVDVKVITGWIKKGWLKAKRRGTNRTAIQGGDIWWIKDMWIKDFIISSVAVIDIRKIDKYWLVDLLAGK